MKSNPRPQWLLDMKKYEVSKNGRAYWQLANTAGPYIFLWGLMAFMFKTGVPYIFIVLTVLPTCFFLVRLFIFFHDACHGSFFSSDLGNRILGRIIGVLTLTSYDDFRYSHGVHHSTAGNLDNRGVGDVWTMTVDEYRSAPKRKQIAYRFFRNPFVLFVLGPVYIFFIRNRIPENDGNKQRFWGVIYTNIGIIVLNVGLCLLVGWRTVLAIQLPISLIASSIGIWLFYVQHQFDPTYWTRSDEWNSIKAALEGSSYYKLPKLLQWATGNIGLHHIHHLRPRIPNYNLERCQKEVPEVQVKKPLTLLVSLKSLRMNLWDEAKGRLISFRQLRHQLKGQDI